MMQNFAKSVQTCIHTNSPLIRMFVHMFYYRKRAKLKAKISADGIPIKIA